MCVCMLSHFTTLWTVALQASLSVELSRQEYWSGLPCHPPGDLPDPGIEPVSLMSPTLVGKFFTTSTTNSGQLFVAAKKAVPGWILSTSRGSTDVGTMTGRGSMWGVRSIMILVGNLDLESSYPGWIKTLVTDAHWEQKASKCGPRSAASASPESLLEMYILGSYPDQLDQELWK